MACLTSFADYSIHSDVLHNVENVAHYSADEDPMVWVILAEDARQAGRLAQARALMEEAYLAFDQTTASY